MKKKLFGLLLFSLVLSSLAYAKVRDTENQEAAQNVAGTSIVKLSPEEEKEAFKALERARKRIEKEDKERELPATGEQETTSFLFLAAITSILSLLIFQKNFKD